MVDSGDPHISIPAGIIIGLLASFVQSLGLTIQRKSHVLNQALPEEQQKVEHRRPLWILGFAIFISSNLFGSIFQIASLPVVILAPLGAVSLLWNAFFARLLLGDVFSPWMVLGTLLIAGGAVLIAVFGIVPEPTHSLEDLLRLFDRPAFIAYFSILAFAVFAWLVTTHVVEYSYTRRYKPVDISPPLSPLLAPTTAPSILTTATTTSHAVDPTSPTERTPLIDRKPHPRSKSPSPSSSLRSMITSPLSVTVISPRTPIFLASSYASISGILSGMCLLFAKSGVELLLLTIGGDNQFWRWQAWVLLLSLIVFALLQLWYMHKGLVLADPTLVCPLAFCFYNLSSIVNGLVYFNQFSMLSTMHLLLVLLGIVVLLGGVWVVSFPPEGGHGVDVGTWTEGEPPTEMVLTGDESDIEAQEYEPYEDEPLPVGSPVHAESPRGRSQTQDGLGPLRVITEPPTPIDAPQLSPNKPPTSRSRIRSPLSPPRAHGRQYTDSALLTSPPRRSQSTLTTSTGAEPTISVSISTDAPSHSHSATQSRRRRRTTLEPGSSLGPLSPSASALGGFSIGLSPISPGFSIVPRERRRRGPGAGSTAGAAGSISGLSAVSPSSTCGGTSSGNTAGGAGGDEGEDPRVPHAWQMRRVVSEGDASARERERRRAGGAGGRDSEGLGLRYGTHGDGEGEGDLERGAGDEGERAADAPAADEGGLARRAKHRWKWLRGVLLGAEP